MARIQHIFSSPRGSIDNITFSKIRQTAYAKRKIMKNASNTPKQQKVRSKFSEAVKLIHPMLGLVRKGFRLYTRTMSAYNNAIQYTIKNALTPDFQIDYSKVLIARGGSLLSAENADFQLRDNEVSITWNDNSNDTDRSASIDKSLTCAFNETRNEVVYNAEGAERSAGTQTLTLPTHWDTGDKLHFYIAFASTTNQNLSNSTYIGESTIACRRFQYYRLLVWYCEYPNSLIDCRRHLNIPTPCYCLHSNS